ncbi:MAG: hypothetical protein QOH20_3567 [Mycobacterium sp.]|nr:hypothetical protein [Mycobacterium sp.]
MLVRRVRGNPNIKPDSNLVVGLPGIPGVEMMACRADPALRGLTPESHSQLDQFGRGRGRSSHARHLRGLIERMQRGVVTDGRGQGQVPAGRPGFLDDLGQSPMHCAAPRQGRVGVDAPGQQRVGESHPVAGPAHRTFGRAGGGRQI